MGHASHRLCSFYEAIGGQLCPGQGSYLIIALAGGPRGAHSRRSRLLRVDICAIFMFVTPSSTAEEVNKRRLNKYKGPHHLQHCRPSPLFIIINNSSNIHNNIFNISFVNKAWCFSNPKNNQKNLLLDFYFSFPRSITTSLTTIKMQFSKILSIFALAAAASAQYAANAALAQRVSAYSKLSLPLIFGLLTVNLLDRMPRSPLAPTPPFPSAPSSRTAESALALPAPGLRVLARTAILATAWKWAATATASAATATAPATAATALRKCKHMGLEGIGKLETGTWALA